MIRLSPEQTVFVTERHLATLTTLREDGSPHVVPVGFTWDAELGIARITTRESSVKVRNAAAGHGGSRAAICQVDGGRWLTFEGTVSISRDPEEIAEAMRRYARRYRELTPDPRRIVLRLAVDRVMGSDYMVR
ncbi:pyridoxamine 5'-phosphate oxidase family protein [Actinotalea sp.]|uniref:pyridoxamine 5'-phosphate oxidase family protein n=1 Tax=Actinotalea sp. TaxID=1872145 RepID=UPI003565D3A2